jgi:hypothetical protein
MDNLIQIEIAFAPTDTYQCMLSIKIAKGTTIWQAISLSGLQNEFKDINFLELQIGIFGKKINPQTYELKDGERIEIYRSLTKTPNQRRLERALLK